MGFDRREFLRIAGLSTLVGLGGASAFEILAPGELEAGFQPTREGLTAKRWGMVIDSGKCLENGECKDCKTACHQFHNVPDYGNPKDEIKWIWKDTYQHVFPDRENEFLTDRLKDKQFVLLCNHCLHPPCVRVCPTQATFKRKSDGIVMMDMHRCIGCRFCMAACPYGSRSFNWRDPRGTDANGRPFIRHRNPEYPTRTKGVVEKCDFCVERLAKGQIPKCVETCEKKRNRALIFGDLEDESSEVRELLRVNYTIRRKPELGTEPSVFYIV
jgi:Fe-S-cluster-containing dehydrogenase component